MRSGKKCPLYSLLGSPNAVAPQASSALQSSSYEPSTQKSSAPRLDLHLMTLQLNLPMTLQLNAVLQWGVKALCFLGLAGCCLPLQVPYLGSDAVDLRYRACLHMNAGRSILCHCGPAQPSVPLSAWHRSPHSVDSQYRNCQGHYANQHPNFWLKVEYCTCSSFCVFVLSRTGHLSLLCSLLALSRVAISNSR